MSGANALVVAEHVLPTPELEQALRDGGFDVRHASPAEVAHRPVPDLVLISASLGVHRVALVAERFGQRSRQPTVVVFPQGDLDALEACVRGGFDYVLPPYLPTLLCGQLTACWERRQLAIALEEMVNEASVRERERDLSIAHEIQAGFLPERLPTPHGWDTAARFRPCRHAAGDFYDGFELVNGRRLAFVVADVSDRGIGAALFMALIRTLLRHTAEHTGNWPEPDEPTPAGPGQPAGPLLSVGAGPMLQAVAATNRYLARNHLYEGYFATLFFGVLDPASGSLLYVNGGHHPAVLVRAGAAPATLPPTGPAVGVFAKSSYQLGHCVIGRGDTLLLYTDGVLDVRGEAGASFGMNRLLRIVAGPPPDSAEALLDTVDAALLRHLGTLEPPDDITLLAVRRQP
ncbi:MAG TPA: PP2C family protein-serine/threonine phosphatase [Pseudonocardiaceae bacterium]|nr:PP2C family protein-serine/threonine phosphatase [Pseudonocardiaceae bacterium]